MKVRMTESQLKRIVKKLTENETLTVSADIHNGDISTGVKNAKADIQRNGLDPNKTKIEVASVTRLIRNSGISSSKE